VLDVADKEPSMVELTPEVKRFLRYVKFDTQSAEDVECYPSTPKQKELGATLVNELKELGLTDAAMDEHGYVMATLPSNVSHKVPVIGLLAHMDTSPDVSGAGVNPQIHANYDGGPIKLNAEYTLSPEQCPDLLKHKGHTLITTDGTTLLGADDKAGIAEIMTALEHLQANPSILHGTIRVGFTPDEEVGNGTKYFDVKKFGAEYAYTVDGETVGEIENETFCADSATVTIHGINVHPGYAKDKLVNALKLAARFIDLLPPHLTPETTEDRQGYVHPVAVSGGADKAVVKLILRDFEERGLKEHHRLLESLAQKVQREHPRARLEVSFSESYRNMRYVLEKHPLVVEYAMEAARKAGVEPKLGKIRGGTDGAKLCFMGLPTPNLFACGHLFHSRFEWVAVEDMRASVDLLVNLAKLWAEKSR
jgi:tripeptide aminopeptidase